MTTTFPDLGLSKWLCNSLASLSIHKPTPIQAACIPPLLEGKNCIGGSRTGSGKTIAFAAPILEIWSRDPFGIYALVLTPTRELALQIYEQFAALGSAQDLKICLVIGGQDMRQQALELQRKPHIVIATPGRLADHVRTSGGETIAGLRRCKVVVLDEADRLLEESFAEALGECLEVLPKERQTALFTATITEEVRELEQMGGERGVFVTEISTDQLKVPPTLQQDYLLLPPNTRESYLYGLLEKYPDTSCIIFTNRTSTATLLTRLLRLLEHRVTPLHSELPQRDRIDSLGRFRAQAARILVATDVASRGLDIPEVGLVINFDVPRNPDDYVHRVGRTARAGRSGRAITFVTPFDVQLVKGIEERVGKELVEAEESKELENFVVREGLRDVSEKKREAKMDIEEGRDARGRRNKKLKDRVMRKREGERERKREGEKAREK